MGTKAQRKAMRRAGIKVEIVHAKPELILEKPEKPNLARKKMSEAQADALRLATETLAIARPRWGGGVSLNAYQTYQFGHYGVVGAGLDPRVASPAEDEPTREDDGTRPATPDHTRDSARYEVRYGGYSEITGMSPTQQGLRQFVENAQGRESALEGARVVRYTGPQPESAGAFVEAQRATINALLEGSQQRMRRQLTNGFLTGEWDGPAIETQSSPVTAETVERVVERLANPTSLVGRAGLIAETVEAGLITAADAGRLFDTPLPYERMSDIDEEGPPF